MEWNGRWFLRYLRLDSGPKDDESTSEVVHKRKGRYIQKEHHQNKPTNWIPDRDGKEIHWNTESWSMDVVPTFIDPHYLGFVLQTPRGKRRNTNQGNSILPQIKVDSDHPVCIILIFIVPLAGVSACSSRWREQVTRNEVNSQEASFEKPGPLCREHHNKSDFEIRCLSSVDVQPTVFIV